MPPPLLKSPTVPRKTLSTIDQRSDCPGVTYCTQNLVLVLYLHAIIAPLLSHCSHQRNRNKRPRMNSTSIPSFLKNRQTLKTAQSSMALAYSSFPCVIIFELSITTRFNPAKAGRRSRYGWIRKGSVGSIVLVKRETLNPILPMQIKEHMMVVMALFWVAVNFS